MRCGKLAGLTVLNYGSLTGYISGKSIKKNIWQPKVGKKKTHIVVRLELGLVGSMCRVHKVQTPCARRINKFQKAVGMKKARHQSIFQVVFF